MTASSEPAAPTVVHTVRSLPEPFRALRDGMRKHDLLRRPDPDYRVGEVIAYREYDPVREAYTGEEVQVRITYITSVENACALSPFGLSPEHCVLSLEPVDGQGDVAGSVGTGDRA